jgi:hypothetical protein
MIEGRFPRIWVPSPENRDVRQLLWHRPRLVQMRTRIMNQLQALAMIAFAILCALRLRAEERMMTEKFGDEYAAYSARTKRLIPGVW